ncbi:MAG: SHD1 domain-containing protein [Rariglobus sp.]
MLALCAAVEARADSVSPVKIGIISDPRSRIIEDLLLTDLQHVPQVSLLERTELPAITEELSLQSVLVTARLDACDVLILLNTFSSGKSKADSVLVIRMISTRTLKVFGLWVYPDSPDPSGLAGKIGGRLKSLLTEPEALRGKQVISLSMLRAESPRLGLLAETTTYRFAAQLQSYDHVSLLERWNVRSPAFEQWLRQTEPSGLTAPDLNIDGAVAEMPSGVGLRISVNGNPREFAPGPEMTDLDKVVVAAAATTAFQGQSPPPPQAAEIIRFEQDARWFWKWSYLTQAAMSADTAIYLGSKNPETHYIRALAYLFPAKEYASNLRYADTPTDAEFSNVLHGVECFLEITPPPASATKEVRKRHLAYAENALLRSSRLIQGMYLSELALPGTERERRRLRDVTRTLAEQTQAFYKADPELSAVSAPGLEHIESLFLPGLLVNYAGFYYSDRESLAAAYADSFETLVRSPHSQNYSMLSSAFSVRALYPNCPWVTDWDNRPPSQEFMNGLMDSLVRSPKPEVRILGCLMPCANLPRDRKKYAPEIAAWLRWMIAPLKLESGFFSDHPTQSTHQTLGLVGGIMADIRRDIKADFPEAEWRDCLNAWLEKAPKGSRINYERQTETLIESFIRASQTNQAAGANAGPTPAEAEARMLFRQFTLAAPSLGGAERVVRSQGHDARVKEWEARKEEEKKQTPAPRLVIESTRRSVERSPFKAPHSPSQALECERILSDSGLGNKGSAVQAANGNVWVMSTSLYPDVITWIEMDALVTTVLRSVRLIDVADYPYGADYNDFAVFDDVIYCPLYNGLYVVDLKTGKWHIVEYYRMGGAKVWVASNRVWITGEPGLIYEYLPVEKRLKLIASAMRTPATHALDAREAYSVSSLFAYDGKIYVWLDDRQLYVRDEATGGWRQIEWDRSGSKKVVPPYPIDLLLGGTGGGNSPTGGMLKNYLETLVPGRTMADALQAIYPPAAWLPAGTTARIGHASSVEDSLWFSFTSVNNEARLGRVRRGTGAATDFPVAVHRDRTGYVVALSSGFILSSDLDGVLYLPRERVDNQYARPAAAPLPPESRVIAETPKPQPENALSRHRIFTDRTGRTLEAEVQGFIDDKVKLKRKDGSVFTVPLTLFSADDGVYLSELRKTKETSE